MELTGIIDRLGEGGTAALGGLVIGALFGAFAQRSRFCLRSAALEFSHGKIGGKVAVWLLAFSSAMLLTQLAILSRGLDVSNARQLAAVGTLSGALIGGLMFGTGMVLARGCASRLLVLSANGNLRALLSGLIFAVTAQAALRGILAPERQWLAGLWTLETPGSRDMLALLHVGTVFALLFALVWFGAALYFGARNRLRPWAWIGGIGCGVMVAAGWIFTYQLSGQSFSVIPVQSMSFSGPSADVLMGVLSPPDEPFSFDVGLVPGVFIGSFIAAWLAKELKVEGFKDGASMWRYIFGAVLMGFGAMLAGGCAVGAGVTGGAIFAVSAWVTLTAIWASAALTDYLVDWKPWQTAAPAPEDAKPAGSPTVFLGNRKPEE